jgi:hypothetical protein
MCKSDTKHICFANPPHLGSMIQRIIEIRKISRRFSSVYLGTMYLLFSWPGFYHQEKERYIYIYIYIFIFIFFLLNLCTLIVLLCVHLWWWFVPVFERLIKVSLSFKIKLKKKKKKKKKKPLFCTVRSRMEMKCTQVNPEEGIKKNQILSSCWF